MDMIFRNRKFGLACFFAAVGTLAFVFGGMTAGEWLGLTGIVLGLYGAANVGDKVANK